MALSPTKQRVESTAAWCPCPYWLCRVTPADPPALHAFGQTAAVGDGGDEAPVLWVGGVRRGGVERLVRLDKRLGAASGPAAGGAVLPGPEHGQDARGGGLVRSAHGAVAAWAARAAACMRLVVAPVA